MSFFQLELGLSGVGRDLLPNPSVLSLLLVSCSLLAPHLAPASPGKLAVRLQLGHIRLQLVLKPCSRFLSVLALHFVLAHAYVLQLSLCEKT